MRSPMVLGAERKKPLVESKEEKRKKSAMAAMAEVSMRIGDLDLGFGLWVL